MGEKKRKGASVYRVSTREQTLCFYGDDISSYLLSWISNSEIGARKRDAEKYV